MTSRGHALAYCGLRLRSEIDLHLPRSATDRGIDVEVVHGAFIDSGQPPPGEPLVQLDVDQGVASWWYRAVRTEHGYTIRFRECGEFRISAGLDRVEVCPDLDGRHELLPILMTGTVGALLLSLRGHTVLHASAVAVDDRAVAFVAASGTGKSTLAALLCANGADLVTDDVLVVSANGHVTCVGAASELRLRSAAAELARGAGSVRTTADDRTAFEPAVVRIDSLPLAAVVLPEPSRTARNPSIEHVRGGERLVAVLRCPRLFGWSDPTVLSRDLSVLGAVTDRTDVVRAVIPWGPPFSDDVTDSLLALARRD